MIKQIIYYIYPTNYKPGRILLMISLLLFIGCVSPTESQNRSKYDAPSDHTVSKKGAKHKSGLKNPNDNCTSCHGADLNGGSIGVSCYDCHGEKW